MPVNIDTVYQRVLSIANKEQRGYITPQEFNLFANQVQMDMFEQYFYDLNQFRRVQGSFESSTDMISIIEDKISIFEEVDGANAMSNYPIAGNAMRMTIPSDVYRITRVEAGGAQAERLNNNDFNDVVDSGPLTKPSEPRPVYNLRKSQLRINNGAPVNPSNTGCGMFYIRKPKTVKWGYVVLNDKALYNSNTSVNFELHPSEETELVIKILSLAGISIEDMALYQIAEAEDARDIQNEKL
tara:strand:+ start:254 stop:976 length:723 start_codon:yes stop_codon:yes gene_type:complete